MRSRTYAGFGTRETVQGGMDITTGNTVLTIRDVVCGNELTIQHVRVETPAARITVPIGSGPCAAELTVVLTVTERELNRVLANQPDLGVRDAQLALLSGSVRISGRYEIMGPFAIPFTLTAVPQVEGGERIRLDVGDVSVVGAALPGFSAQMIGERLNGRLSEALNVRRLGIPLRLVGVTVETGRLNVTARAEMEWRPGESGIVRSSG